MKLRAKQKFIAIYLLLLVSITGYLLLYYQVQYNEKQSRNYLKFTKSRIERQTSKPHKIMLFPWSKPWFGSNQSYTDGLYPAFNDTFRRSCYLTNDFERYKNTADVVVFDHFRSDPDQMQTATKHEKQIWAFRRMETANGHPVIPVEGRFNWFMGYQHDSDVVENYFAMKKREKAIDRRNITESFVASFPHRKYDALWYVSHCSAHSRMELLAKSLERFGITVDYFGSCTKRSPDEIINKIGEKAFVENYRYYFSFENSICTDYISEKLERGLNFSFNYGLIPIRHGERITDERVGIPRNSYIYAEDFKDIAELARFLKDLKRNPVMIAEYYQWHSSHTMISNHQSRITAVSVLCKKLYEEEDTNCKTDGYGNVIHPCISPTRAILHLPSRVGSCRKPKIDFN